MDKKHKTLAQLQEEYDKEQGTYKAPARKVEKAKTFEELSLAERAQLYEISKSTYHHYHENRKLPVVELLSSYDNRSHEEVMEELRQQGQQLAKEKEELRLELMKSDIDKMRSELEAEGWL